MSPRFFLDNAILPAYELLPARMASSDASAQILAIALQESRLQHRKQIGGPARSYAQFELSGGIDGVLTHPATRGHIRDVLDALDYDADALGCYFAIEHNDILCAAFSRLLLWIDPAPLPTYGQDQDAWEYYLRNWRPGKPHRSTWNECFEQAWAVVGVPSTGDEP